MKTQKRWTKKTGIIFYITPTKIYAETKLQFFIIEPSNRYTTARFLVIKKEILNKRTTTLVQLISKHGRFIIMIPSQKKYMKKG